MTITKITTRGYSGPGTQFQYMPPGELTVADETSVGKMTVTQELAKYLMGIGIAEEIEMTVSGASVQVVNPDKASYQFAPVDEKEDSVVIDGIAFSVQTTINFPDLSAMSRAELIEYALKVGIELPPGYLTKDKLIALITATNE